MAHGLATYLPFLENLKSKGTGGTDEADYCYSVWLRHLTQAAMHGFTRFPHTVAELGPGDSVGIGLAALLSGVEQYVALDIVAHSEVKTNLQIFDGLVALFQRRADIPDNNAYPKVMPGLPDYRFPHHILSEQHLEKALHSERVERIRQSILDCQSEQSMIVYHVPWYDAGVVQEKSIDMIYSQAVMEHVDQLEETYEAMRLWLKDDGFMTHTIDYSCHNTAEAWNGHWAYSDFTWKIIKGRRPYLLNRQTHSTQVKLFKKAGFQIVDNQAYADHSGLVRSQLSSQYRDISDDDVTTRRAFVIAVKN